MIVPNLTRLPSMMRGGGGRGGGGGIEAALGAAAGSFLAGAWGAAGAMMAQGSGTSRWRPTSPSTSPARW